MDQPGREAGVLDQDAHLDVAGLAAVGEIGGGHESPGFVDDDALGVEAEPLSIRPCGAQQSPAAAR